MFNFAYQDLVQRLVSEAFNPNAARRAPRGRPPDLQAARYSADLRRLVDQLEYLLMRHLSDLKTDSRMDANLDRLFGDIFGDIAVLWGRGASDSWDRTASDVDRANLQEVNQQWRSVLGIDYPELGSALRGSLEASRDANVGLITGLADEQLDIIRQELRRMGPGATVGDIAAMIRERMSVTRSRASLIARDQVLKLNSNLTQLRHQEAGIEEYEWSASMDERTRQSTNRSLPSYNRWQDHRALNGKIFSWDKPPVVNKKNGARAHPGEYFQCRCIATPVFRDSRGKIL